MDYPGAPATAQVFTLEVTGCIDCHRDPHAGTADAYLGDAGCLSCHDGESWMEVSLAPVPGIVRFDHDATGFALEGAHRIVGCSECHAVTSAPFSDCHSLDNDFVFVWANWIEYRVAKW